MSKKLSSYELAVLAELRLIRYALSRQQVDFRNFQEMNMAALDDLDTEVEETRGTVESAVTLIEGLKAALDEAIASGDIARVQAIRDKLDQSQQRLANAVAANPLPSQP